MKLLVLLAFAVGVVFADIGLTLNNYRVPDTSYGVPSYQYSNDDDGVYDSGYTYSAESGLGYQDASFEQLGYGFQSTGSFGGDSVYQGGNFQNNLGSSEQYQTGGANSGFNTAQPHNQLKGDASQAGYQNLNQYKTSNQWYESSSAEKYQQIYNQWQQAPAQVYKHFYVHAAPEETEKPQMRKPITLPPPQKHYKIIFIKAPSQTVYEPQYIPIPQPNEEKTIVYVLVKKPEEQQEIVVPKLENKPPAKPEVFFIKYNNKVDSQAVINNIVNDYNKVNTVSFANGGSEGQYIAGQSSQSQGGYNYASSSSSSQAGKVNTVSLDIGGSAGQGSQSGAFQGGYNYAPSSSSSQAGKVNTVSLDIGGSAGQGSQSGAFQGGYNYASSSSSSQAGKVNTVSLANGGSAGQGSQSGAFQGGYNYAPSSSNSQSQSYNEGSSSSVTSAAGHSSATSEGTVASSSTKNVLSTSQGVPHETYGPPAFKI